MGLFFCFAGIGNYGLLEDCLHFDIAPVHAGRRIDGSQPLAPLGASVRRTGLTTTAA